MRWIFLCLALSGCSGQAQDELDVTDEDPATSSDAAVEIAPSPGKEGNTQPVPTADAGLEPDAAVLPDGGDEPDSAAPVELRTLTVAVDGNGDGTVSGVALDRQVIACTESDGDCAETLDDGSVVVLTAAPSEDSSFLWGGACEGETSSQCTVALTEARDVRVSFPLRIYTLRVTVQGTGLEPGAGTVTSTPAGIQCTTGGDPEVCTMQVEARSSVQLNATPTPRDGSDRNRLDAWGGACAGSDGTTCDLVISDDTEVSAGFTLVVG